MEQAQLESNRFRHGGCKGGVAYTFPSLTSEPGLSSTVPPLDGGAGVAAVIVSPRVLRPVVVSTCVFRPAPYTPIIYCWDSQRDGTNTETDEPYILELRDMC